MTITKDNITAVILAGGRGSRLGGQDKGLIDFNGKPLIETILNQIKPQVGKILINANRNQAIYEGYGYPVFNDDLSDFQGPLAGFASAMEIAKTSHIITLPCDGPAIAPQYVSRMINSTQRHSNTIVVAHDGIRMQPIYALVPIGLLKSLQSFLANGDRKVDLWYAKHHCELADFSDTAKSFANINTKEEQQKIQKDTP